MRFKALISGMVALLVLTCLAPQAGILSKGLMFSEALKVESLSPDRGTVMFIAQTGGNPAPGVEIRIDGKSKGFTGEDGKLKVEWLLFGNHVWEAVYEGEEISQGEFEIEKIADMEILDFHYEKNGKKVNEFYPLKDTLRAVQTWGNTGTTLIDHWTWKLRAIPSTKEMEIKILHPKIPSRITNMFKGIVIELSSPERGWDFFTKENKLYEVNIFTQKHEQFGVKEPFAAAEQGGVAELPTGYEGLKPGETIVVFETRPYAQWIREGIIENKTMKIDATLLKDEEDPLHTLVMKGEYRYGPIKLQAKDIEFRTFDKESGIMSMKIKEAKCGPVKLKDIEALVQLKGPVRMVNWIYIDDKLCDSKEFDFNLLYKERLGGETVGKSAGNMKSS